jgi:hypothetical protein
MSGGPYDYVRRMYGVEPIVGARVRHTETGRFGVIAPMSPTHGHYVQVRFDGQRFASNCHPTALDYSAPPTT